ncbi:unnamed protein product [Amoebophrya sp. A120]|nr:unnamed protein product [Amoebophrya sp. A120]|eukprot:GSA120T00007714001.1
MARNHNTVDDHQHGDHSPAPSTRAASLSSMMSLSEFEEAELQEVDQDVHVEMEQESDVDGDHQHAAPMELGNVEGISSTEISCPCAGSSTSAPPCVGQSSTGAFNYSWMLRKNTSGATNKMKQPDARTLVRQEFDECAGVEEVFEKRANQDYYLEFLALKRLLYKYRLNGRKIWSDELAYLTRPTLSMNFEDHFQDFDIWTTSRHSGEFGESKEAIKIKSGLSAAQSPRKNPAVVRDKAFAKAVSGDWFLKLTPEQKEQVLEFLKTKWQPARFVSQKSLAQTYVAGVESNFKVKPKMFLHKSGDLSGKIAEFQPPAPMPCLFRELYTKVKKANVYYQDALFFQARRIYRHPQARIRQHPRRLKFCEIVNLVKEEMEAILKLGSKIQEKALNRSAELNGADAKWIEPPPWNQNRFLFGLF